MHSDMSGVCACVCVCLCACGRVPWSSKSVLTFQENMVSVFSLLSLHHRRQMTSSSKSTTCTTYAPPLLDSNNEWFTRSRPWDIVWSVSGWEHFPLSHYVVVLSCFRASTRSYSRLKPALQSGLYAAQLKHLAFQRTKQTKQQPWDTTMWTKQRQHVAQRSLSRSPCAAWASAACRARQTLSPDTLRPWDPRCNTRPLLV